jgi:hypothetical protein
MNPKDFNISTVLDSSTISADVLNNQTSWGTSLTNNQYISTTGSPIWTTAPGYTAPSDLVISRPGRPDIRVGETLEAIMERLAILAPDFDKMEKYPALRAAYDNYRTIEAMIGSGEDEQ